MIWWVIGSYIIFGILILPFRVKVKLSYDLGQNDGKISVFISKLKIYTEDFQLKYNAIVLKSKKGDKETTFKDFGKSNFGDIFAINLMKSIKINTIKTDIQLGVADCCYFTSIVSGVLLVFQKIFFSYLSQKRDVSVLKSVVTPSYKNNQLIARFSFSVTTCLLMIIICLFNAVFKIERGVKIYGKQSS